LVSSVDSYSKGQWFNSTLPQKFLFFIKITFKLYKFKTLMNQKNKLNNININPYIFFILLNIILINYNLIYFTSDLFYLFVIILINIYLIINLNKKNNSSNFFNFFIINMIAIFNKFSNLFKEIKTYIKLLKIIQIKNIYLYYFYFSIFFIFNNLIENKNLIIKNINNIFFTILKK